MVAHREPESVESHPAAQVEARGWSWGTHYDHGLDVYTAWVRVKGDTLYTYSHENEAQAIAGAYITAVSAQIDAAEVRKAKRDGARLAMELGMIDRRSYVPLNALERVKELYVWLSDAWSRLWERLRG